MGFGYNDYRALLERFLVLLQDSLGDGLVAVVVYGSVARGTAGRESDVDLLVVVEDEIADPDRLISSVESELEMSPEYETVRKVNPWPLVSPITLTRSKACESRWIFLDMVDDAIVFYDKGGFFQERIGRLRRRLGELGSRKVALPDGSWYWNIKPDLRPGEVFEL